MICILDLGTSKISSILVKDEDTNPEVLAFSSIETSGIKTGAIINIGLISEDISKSINELENKSGEKIKDIVVSFSGEQISSIGSTGSAIIRQKEVTARDVQSALNMSSTLKVPNDKTLLFVTPNEYNIDGQPGIAEPIGMNGVRLEARTHLIYCSQNMKENISKCVEELNDLRIQKFYFNQLGAAQSVLTQDQRDLGVCLLDIGAGTTDLTIYKGGSIRFSKVFPYAGDFITETIATSLKITSIQAEEIKKKYGCATLDSDSEDTLRIKGTNGNKEIEISRKALSEVIEKSLTRIISHCANCVEDNGMLNYMPTGYVLTGGTANLEGVQKLGEDVTKTNFEIGLPKVNIPNKSEHLKKPQFSPIIGMIKFCALEKKKQFTFNQSRGIIGRMLEWFRSEFGT